MRRFGSNAKSKLVNGVVVGVVNKPTATGRSSWYVKGRFDVGGGTMKVGVLHVRSVKEAPSESPNDAIVTSEGGGDPGGSNEVVETNGANSMKRHQRFFIISMLLK